MIFNLPCDIFKHELLQYLTLYDIAIFDTAIINHIYRPKLLNKISEITFSENINIYKFNIKLLYKWLIIRKINNIFKRDEQIIQMPKDTIICDTFNDFYFRDYLNSSGKRIKYLENIDFFEYDVNGKRPIHHICFLNKTSIIKYIIDKGINLEVEILICKRRPIHIICEHSTPDMIKYIIEKGVNLEVADSTGFRPLHYICKFSTPDMLKYIIDKNVDLEANTYDGTRPIDLICDNYKMKKYFINIDLKKEKDLSNLFKKKKNTNFCNRTT